MVTVSFCPNKVLNNLVIFDLSVHFTQTSQFCILENKKKLEDKSIKTESVVAQDFLDRIKSI